MVKKILLWGVGITSVLLLAVLIAYQAGLVHNAMYGKMPSKAEIAGNLEVASQYHYLDQDYSEPLTAKSLPIDHIEFDMESGLEGWIAFIEDILSVRYPVGQINVTEGLKAMAARAEEDPNGCLVPFYSVHPVIDLVALIGVRSREDAINMAPLAVHECGHIHDMFLNGKDVHNHAKVAYYQITPETILVTENLGLIEDGGGTFSRSMLGADAHSDLPDGMNTCTEDGEQGCDVWSGMYLLDEAGFDLLLEEFNQYTHSLAAAYFLDDHDDERKFYSSTTSATLAFRWYTMRYLHLARTKYPEVYEVITGSSCNVDTILTLWDRSSFYLDVVRDHGALNQRSNALAYRAVEETSELRNEIATLRELERVCEARQALSSSQ